MCFVNCLALVWLSIIAHGSAQLLQERLLADLPLRVALHDLALVLARLCGVPLARVVADALVERVEYELVVLRLQVLLQLRLLLERKAH